MAKVVPFCGPGSVRIGWSASCHHTLGDIYTVDLKTFPGTNVLCEQDFEPSRSKGAIVHLKARRFVLLRIANRAGQLRGEIHGDYSSAVGVTRLAIEIITGCR